jgi:hypothetical protein
MGASVFTTESAKWLRPASSGENPARVGSDTLQSFEITQKETAK